jgi:hypothetical protein
MKDTKIQCATAALLMLLTVGSALGQPQLQPFPGPAPRGTPNGSETLTKFDLDFPGGSPKELVAAIEKASGKPLNAIVPDEFAKIKISALKMKNVDAPQLFRAIQAASAINRSPNSFQPGFPPAMSPSGGNSSRIAYGFQSSPGSLTDDTIWYFYAEKPAEFYPPPSPPKECRFYSLAPYLDRGMTVDDITTAIKTGAKMLGEGQEPAISFHKDTKLLIAVGESGKLQIIDAVLKALEPPKGIPGAPKPAEKKTEGF